MNDYAFTIDVLEHTSRTGRYVTDEARVFQLADKGLLNDHGTSGIWPVGTRGFTLSETGREKLREHWSNFCRFPQPKPKRPASPQFVAWREYCDGCSHVSFAVFLKDVWPFRRSYL